MVTVNIELRSTQRLFGLTSKLSTSAIVNNNVTIIIADRRNWFKLRLLEEIYLCFPCVSWNVSSVKYVSLKLFTKFSSANTDKFSIYCFVWPSSMTILCRNLEHK